jgi:hypothetical protein
MASVRITKAPPGEAPVSVRQAWVGLELPLLRDRPRLYITSGVLSGPRGFVQTLFHLLARRLTLHIGFVVSALPAIEVLEASRPVAARWWREHAPHLLRGRRYFVFPTECCELVEQRGTHGA